MTQGENKDVIRYDKSKKYSDCSDKNLRTYEDKEKIEDGIDIVVRFANETKIDAETALEANGECEIMSTFKVKEKKNSEEIKIKGMLSILRRNEKEELW